MAIAKIQWLRIALPAAGIGLVGFLALTLMGSTSINQTEVENGGNINRLQIESTLPGVNILLEPSNDDNIKMSVQGSVTRRFKDDYKVHAARSGNTLKITMLGKENGLLGNTMGGEAELKINLPKKIYKDIQLNSSIGDVHMQQVEAGTLSVKMDTGELVMDGLQTKKLNAAITTGTMDLQLSGGQMQLDTTTGDIKVGTNKVDESIVSHTQTGDITLLVANSPIAMRGEFGSTLGDVTVNLPNFQFNQINDNLKKGFIGAGGPLVHLTSKNGDIEMMIGK